MLKWEVSYMVDPGDGIVSKEVVESESDDLCEVASDWFNKFAEEERDPYFMVGIQLIERV